MQVPREERLTEIAEGLRLLAEQVETLDGDLTVLAESKRWRGLEMLSAQADEEAAKALILLDFMRMDQHDEEALARQLGRFYNHLARCIYAEMTHMSPADFAEVRTTVDTMRPSHYLDGPNDVDWIFRNQLLAHREESLYVDYIHEEEGERWVTPASNDVFMYPPPVAPVRRLVGSLNRLGAMSPGGLKIVAKHWTGVSLNDGTHWQETMRVNQAIVEELIDRRIPSSDATPEDGSFVVGQWPFPMGDLDLRELPVDLSELEAKRGRWSPDL
jgi:hypothetical protein